MKKEKVTSVEMRDSRVQKQEQCVLRWATSGEVSDNGNLRRTLSLAKKKIV